MMIISTKMQTDINKKLNAIIVDDEQDGREVLFQLLGKYAPNVTVVGEAEDADIACKLIDELRPHLVFLDIQMVGKNGFSVLETCGEIDFEVIFVTSYEQYAITAIKFNALDYLLKPLDVDELKLAIEKAVKRIDSRLEYEERIKNLLKDLERNQAPTKIAVHLNDSVYIVNLNEVMYVEADGNYCRIVMEQKQVYLVTRMLKELEEYLGPQSFFVRISKSVLINMDFIVKYSKGEPCILTLKDNQHFEVSRRKKQEILDKLKQREQE